MTASAENWQSSYDEWKERLPEEPISDDPDCTCTSRRRDRWCPVHGLDPDDERDKRIEDEWDRDKWQNDDGL